MNDSILSDYIRLKLREMEGLIVSQLSDKIAEVKASQDEAIARVQDDVLDLQTQIDDLRGRVTTPEDIAELEAIDAKNKALDPLKPDTLPPG